MGGGDRMGWDWSRLYCFGPALGGWIWDECYKARDVFCERRGDCTGVYRNRLWALGTGL